MVSRVLILLLGALQLALQLTFAYDANNMSVPRRYVYPELPNAWIIPAAKSHDRKFGNKVSNAKASDSKGNRKGDPLYLEDPSSTVEFFAQWKSNNSATADSFDKITSQSLVQHLSTKNWAFKSSQHKATYVASWKDIKLLAEAEKRTSELNPTTPKTTRRKRGRPRTPKHTPKHTDTDTEFNTDTEMKQNDSESDFEPTTPTTPRLKALDTEMQNVSLDTPETPRSLRSNRRRTHQTPMYQETEYETEQKEKEISGIVS